MPVPWGCPAPENTRWVASSLVTICIHSPICIQPISPIPPLPQVTMMFSDLVGYTEMASGLHPETVLIMLHSIFHTLDRVCGYLRSYKYEASDANRWECNKRVSLKSGYAHPSESEITPPFPLLRSMPPSQPSFTHPQPHLHPHCHPHCHPHHSLLPHPHPHPPKQTVGDAYMWRPTSSSPTPATACRPSSWESRSCRC